MARATAGESQQADCRRGGSGGGPEIPRQAGGPHHRHREGTWASAGLPQEAERVVGEEEGRARGEVPRGGGGQGGSGHPGARGGPGGGPGAPGGPACGGPADR
ncbi:hypothetical protein PVAP13_3NG249801 [Panicum virgatum]|uniref:Uncharacterized protein n=1 Tax=Panicum virgatum TaxID=38727 RepID=A0A8T0U177_PANVG|nr:hypothetical protein PVAP13_3NG249801 [Panicum virgatum]